MDSSTTATTCPICGWTEFDSLQDHLNAHSKQDLINLLIQQQNPLSVTLSSHTAPVRSGKVLLPGFSYNEALTSHDHDDISQDNLSIVSCNSQSPGSSRSLTNLEPVNALEIKSDLNISSVDYEDDDDDSTRYDLVPVCSFSVPLTEVHESSRSSLRTINQNEINGQDAESHQEVILLQSYTENSETSAGQLDDTRSEENVPEESDNATATSIIKYIIDQSDNKTEEGQGEPDRWILPDGRAIPVYSSFTQVHIVSKPEISSSSSASAVPITKETLDERLIVSSTLSERIGGQVQLDLMTDEEIPPRGEISEYEESNTSSFVSEDSNIRLANLTDSKRASPVVSVELDTLSMSTTKRKRKVGSSTTSRTTGVNHEFLCYECPKVQKFKSLFELIGHKMKVHPNKHIGCSSISTANISIAQSSSSMSMLISNVVGEKILPEVDDSVMIEELELDEKKKVQRKEFFCVYCNFISNNKNELTRHMETVHQDKPAKPSIFECNTCGKTFPARTNLRKHLLVHKERKHTCTTCSKGFTSNFKLMEHVRVHTKIYPYKCDACDKSYRTPSLLNHHVKHLHRPESERPIRQKVEFYCGICHKILRSKRSYLCHTQVHHAKPKKCPFCCETFIRPSVLVRHIRVSHDSQYESVDSKDCPVCHKKFHPNSMIKHMRIHANEKPYPCTVCSKNFRTYANLTSHSWSHTNIDKPFKCRLCSKSYLFRKTLEHHMMVHKKRTLHFVCNECGVKFTHKVNMKRHLEEHNSEKKFICKICGKKFQRNYYLLEHERIHTGLKPFVCNICGKASTTKSNHRAHIKIHDARDSGSQEG